MILLDVNVLLALADSDHAHHSRAKNFFLSRLQGAWATCPITENGFIRVISGRSYSNPAENSESARLLLEKMIQSTPGHQFWTDDASLCDTKLFPSLPPAKHLTACYLLALAVKRGGKFATFDQRIDPAWVRGGHHALVLVEA